MTLLSGQLQPVKGFFVVRRINCAIAIIIKPNNILSLAIAFFSTFDNIDKLSQQLDVKIIIISLWLQIKHIIFLCVPFLRKPYFMRIMSRQKSINKRASQCG